MQPMVLPSVAYAVTLSCTYRHHPTKKQIASKDYSFSFKVICFFIDN